MAGRGFLLLLCVSSALTMEISMKCERDSDCFDEEGVHYCLFSVCETCIPCESIFQRQSPSTPNGRALCARKEEDCGVCLPGYRSEDLVDQKRSFKCYPASYYEEKISDSYFTNVTETSIRVILTSIFIGLLLTVLAAGCCLVYVKHRQVKRAEMSGRREEESRKFIDRLPPPYELPEDFEAVCRPVGTLERNFTIVAAQEEYLNQATPMHHYHHLKPRMDSEIEDSNFLNQRELHSTNEDGNGSTETIPSLWEPISAIDVEMESNDPALYTRTESQELIPLTRSQSLELPALRPISNCELSTSDPALVTSNRRRVESYAHRHVRLSRHRLANVPATPQDTDERCTDQLTNGPSCSFHTSGDDCDEDCEPNEPQSFTYDENQMSSEFLTTSMISFTGSLYGRPLVSSTPTANEGGSRDSGFFDQSRRRPASDEASFGLTLFIKRHREFQ